MRRISKFQQLLPRRLPHLHLQLQQLQQVDVDGDHHVEGHDDHVDDQHLDVEDHDDEEVNEKDNDC